MVTVTAQSSLITQAAIVTAPATVLATTVVLSATINSLHKFGIALATALTVFGFSTTHSHTMSTLTSATESSSILDNLRTFSLGELTNSAMVDHRMSQVSDDTNDNSKIYESK